MSLRAEGLHFGYGSGCGSPEVIKGLSLELRPFTTVGVVGPNGAGKSTVIGLLTRVLTPSHGEVSLDGVPVNRWSRLGFARRVAVVAQGGELPGDFSVYDIVMMGRTPHIALGSFGGLGGFWAAEGPADREAVARAMRRTDTWSFRDRRVGALSGGERQRVLLARALAQEPSYLLLDEPTNHLDLKYQVEVLATARREVARGLGVLVVLHDLNLAARVCDRVLVLRGGELVAEGAPAEVFTEGLVREVYGADAHVFAQPGTHAPVVLPRL